MAENKSRIIESWVIEHSIGITLFINFIKNGKEHFFARLYKTLGDANAAKTRIENIIGGWNA